MSNNEALIVFPGPMTTRIARMLSLLILAAMPFLFGAVQAWVWSVFTVAMYASYTIQLQHGQGSALVPVLNGWWVTMGVFLLVTLAACLPLSDWFLAWLSPKRYALLTQVNRLSGATPVSWTISYSPMYSMAWWAFLLGLMMFFCVMRLQFAHRSFLRLTLWVLFGMALLEALYGILQALVPNLGVLWIDYYTAQAGSARGTYINRNHFAGLMEMLLPLLLGFGLSRVAWSGRLRLAALLRSERLHQHMLVVMGLVIMALALLFSKSRGGISGGILSMVVFMLLLRGRNRKLPMGVYAALGFFLLLILFYGLNIGFGPIIERFLALDQGGDGRLDIWRDSLTMIAGHPMGIGLAAFKTVFPVYHVSATTDATMPYYLHNDWLQLLAETGWIGVISLGGAFLVFMGLSCRRIRRMDPTNDPQRFFLAIGAFSGLAALGFHSLMDFNLQIPANATYFVMLLSMVRTLAYDEIQPPE